MRNYSATPATRALTPTGGFLEGFSYSLNPYIGYANATQVAQLQQREMNPFRIGRSEECVQLFPRDHHERL